VEKGIIPIYIKLLTKSNIHLVEQAVWGVGNIAADCITFRNQLISNGAMVALVELYTKVKSNNQKMKEQTIWAASNLCRLKPPPEIAKVYQGIPMFAEVLLETTKQNVLTDCCWGLSQTCRSETVQLLEKAGIIKRVIELMYSPQLVISHPCLRIVGVFTNGEDRVCQQVLDNNGLDALEHLLSSTTKVIRKEALWAISNITAGNEKQIGMVIGKPSLLDKLFTIISTDIEENKIEAVWGICNSTKHSTFEQISFLMSKGLIDLFCGYLGKDQDSKMLNVILEALFVIAEKIKLTRPALMDEFIDTLFNKGVIEKIEALQTHQNNNVYKKSYNFITSFLETEQNI
jgi:importin subunit alpha-2